MDDDGEGYWDVIANADGKIERHFGPPPHYRGAIVSAQEDVDTTIRLLRDFEQDSHHELLVRLVDAGIDAELAHRLLVLVPLAFSRAYYDRIPMIKEYAEEFIVCNQATGEE